jgi:hypothetical protein
MYKWLSLSSPTYSKHFVEEYEQTAILILQKLILETRGYLTFDYRSLRSCNPERSTRASSSSQGQQVMATDNLHRGSTPRPKDLAASLNPGNNGNENTGGHDLTLGYLRDPPNYEQLFGAVIYHLAKKLKAFHRNVKFHVMFKRIS